MSASSLASGTGFPVDETKITVGFKKQVTIKVPPSIAAATVCTIRVVDITQSTLVAIIPSTIIFTSSKLEDKVEIHALQNALDPDEDCLEVDLVLQCTSTTPDIDRKYLTVKIVKPDSDIKDDPHFQQTIYGIDEYNNTVQKVICYDLTGKSGDKFQIISDEILNFSVYIALRDDYYIGKVYVKGPMGLFDIDTSRVALPSNAKKFWSEKFNLKLKKEGILLNLKKKSESDRIFVKIFNEGRSLSLSITRVKQNFGKSYLNIMIDETTGKNSRLDRYHGGLLGEIFNKKFIFHEQVQKEARKAALRINNRLVEYWIKNISGSSKDLCYMMNLKDLLYPNDSSLYKKETI